jgi:hypothetical protein
MRWCVGHVTVSVRSSDSSDSSDTSDSSAIPPVPPPGLFRDAADPPRGRFRREPRASIFAGGRLPPPGRTGAADRGGRIRREPRRRGVPPAVSVNQQARRLGHPRGRAPRGSPRCRGIPRRSSRKRPALVHPPPVGRSGDVTADARLFRDRSPQTHRPGSAPDATGPPATAADRGFRETRRPDATPERGSRGDSTWRGNARARPPIHTPPTFGARLVGIGSPRPVSIRALHHHRFVARSFMLCGLAARPLGR